VLKIIKDYVAEALKTFDKSCSVRESCRTRSKITCLKETQRQNTSGFQMKVENTSYTMVPKILATADPSIFN